MWKLTLKQHYNYVCLYFTTLSCAIMVMSSMEKNVSILDVTFEIAYEEIKSEECDPDGTEVSEVAS